MRLLFVSIPLLLLTACDERAKAVPPLNTEGIVRTAEEYLTQEVITITAFVAERSAGGLHDYYSEGLYWWPDEGNRDGPYLRRDGVPNPGNFSGHKSALRNFSTAVTTLTAAYEITGEEVYGRRAADHLRAWFVAPATRMNPSLLYGQAIKGITTGRGIGIIDTEPLINVALSTILLEAAGLLEGNELAGVKRWFGEYGDWLTTHPYGHAARQNNNNHSTWWGAQLAAFARAADRPDLLKIAGEQFRAQLPIQIASDGSLPDELGRTKPFHYLNYNLRAWTTFATLLSSEKDDFWKRSFTAELPPFGREPTGNLQDTITLQKALEFALPHFKNPEHWPYSTELEPSIQPYANYFLVLAGWGLHDDTYLDLWRELATEKDELAANLVLWRASEGYLSD